MSYLKKLVNATFDCHNCDNTDPNEVVLYNGLLGYEASICKCCGAYADHEKSYDADDWSLKIINKTKEQVEHLNNNNSSSVKMKH